MKYSILQVVLSAITTAILVAGSVQMASANENAINGVVVAQDQLRDFADHPVHLGAEEQVFALRVEPAENVEDMAAVYEKDGGCE